MSLIQTRVILTSLLCLVGAAGDCIASRPPPPEWDAPPHRWVSRGFDSIQGAEKLLSERLDASPNPHWYRENAAAMMVLAKTRPSTARSIAERILEGKTHPDYQDSHPTLLYRRLATATLAWLGDLEPLHAEVATRATGDPSLQEQFLLAKAGDRSWDEPYLEGLRSQDSYEGVCQALRFAGPFLEAASQVRAPLIREIELKAAMHPYALRCGFGAVLWSVYAKQPPAEAPPGVVTMLSEALQRSVPATREDASWMSEVSGLWLTVDTRAEADALAVIGILEHEGSQFASLPTLRSAALQAAFSSESALVRASARMMAMRFAWLPAPPPGEANPHAALIVAWPRLSGRGLPSRVELLQPLAEAPVDEEWHLLLSGATDFEIFTLAETLDGGTCQCNDHDAKLRQLWKAPGIARHRQALVRLLESQRLTLTDSERNQEISQLLGRSDAFEHTALATRFPWFSTSDSLDEAWMAALTDAEPWVRLAAHVNALAWCARSLEQVPAHVPMNDLAEVLATLREELTGCDFSGG